MMVLCARDEVNTPNAGFASAGKLPWIDFRRKLPIVGRLALISVSSWVSLLVSKPRHRI